MKESTDVTASVSKVAPENWVDISNEKYRTYYFGGGKEYTVTKPQKLNVKRKPEGDSHRIEDAFGKAHYIPSSWIALSWEGENGVAFSF